MIRLLRQCLLLNPFYGDIQVSRVWVLRPSTRNATLPFPSRTNYHRPLDILETFFAKADRYTGTARHNRYLECPGFPPVLITRDPDVIRAILTATGDRQGQFDRDTMPSAGIARATGPDTLLFSNGPQWRQHRQASSKPFGKTALFREEIFAEFEETFRQTVAERIALLRAHLAQVGKAEIEIQLEPEIKGIMMEMLLKNFFGATLDREEIRDCYIPAIDRIIEHIVRDTVEHRFRILPRIRRRSAGPGELQEDFERFEQLTDRAIEPRRAGRAAWAKVDPQISDSDLRSNIKVFLAGALEATTSYATWAISHLARSPAVQQRVRDEVAGIHSYEPHSLEQAPCLQNVLRETLRLTPSLYFLPRRANADTWLEVSDGRRLFLPRGTHILLDVWHANRLEEYWGMEKTGFLATEFQPDRWLNIDASEKSKEYLHFGFGHGARVCPGKHLGELEAALVVGGLVKLFEMEALSADNPARAGVSTKPADGTLVRLRLRPQDMPVPRCD